MLTLSRLKKDKITLRDAAESLALEKGTPATFFEATGRLCCTRGLAARTLGTSRSEVRVTARKISKTRFMVSVYPSLHFSVHLDHNERSEKVRCSYISRTNYRRHCERGLSLVDEKSSG